MAVERSAGRGGLAARLRSAIVHVLSDECRQSGPAAHEDREGSLGEVLDYARRLYGNVLDWYKAADAKGQNVLTVDGALLTIISGLIFTKAGDLAELKQAFGAETWCFGIAASLCLVSSITCAIQCLRSRLGGRDIKEWFRTSGVDANRAETYTADVLWWFGTIAHLRSDATLARLRHANAELERDALLSQVVALSANTLSKHRWVNAAWVLTGVTLVFVAATAASYVVRVG